MLKKDYILIANALASVKPSDPTDYHRNTQWENDVTVITKALERDNGRFDRARFMTACGLDN